MTAQLAIVSECGGAEAGQQLTPICEMDTPSVDSVPIILPRGF